MAASLGRENVEVLNPEPLATPACAIEIVSVTLDQFCRAQNVKPDVLKVDAEGAELLILRVKGNET